MYYTIGLLLQAYCCDCNITVRRQYLRMQFSELKKKLVNCSAVVFYTIHIIRFHCSTRLTILKKKMWWNIKMNTNCAVSRWPRITRHFTNLPIYIAVSSLNSAYTYTYIGRGQAAFKTLCIYLGHYNTMYIQGVSRISNAFKYVISKCTIIIVRCARNALYLPNFNTPRISASTKTIVYICIIITV